MTKAYTSLTLRPLNVTGLRQKDPDDASTDSNRPQLTPTDSNGLQPTPTKSNQFIYLEKVDDMGKRDVDHLTLDEHRERFNKIVKRCQNFRTQNKIDRTTSTIDPMRWAFRIPLSSYAHTRWIPDIVNVVSLCNLIPVDTSVLPLDLF